MICVITFLVSVSILAYEILSDEKKRKEYDWHGPSAFEQDGSSNTNFKYDDFFQEFDHYREHKHGSGRSKFHFDFNDAFDGFDFGGFDSFFGADNHFANHFATFDDGGHHRDHMRNHMKSAYDGHHHHQDNMHNHMHHMDMFEQFDTQGKYFHNHEVGS